MNKKDLPVIVQAAAVATTQGWVMLAFKPYSLREGIMHLYVALNKTCDGYGVHTYNSQQECFFRGEYFVYGPKKLKYSNAFRFFRNVNRKGV